MGWAILALLFSSLAVGMWATRDARLPDHSPAAIKAWVDRTGEANRAREQWQKLLVAEDNLIDAQIDDALKPLDEYFHAEVFPHLDEFLDEFQGLFYGTPRFISKWMSDQLAVNGNSERVNDLVRDSLQHHIGFPDKMNAATDAAMRRYYTLAGQRDADLRDKAYNILHGAGSEIDAAALKQLLAGAHDAAVHSTFKSVAADNAVSFGGASVGREAASLAIQVLIINRVMVALGTRMGIITTGATAAGATAGAGTATGVGTVPGLVVAAGEITLAVAVDLALSYWLQNRAEGKMREQFEEVHQDLRKQLSNTMYQYSKQLHRQRIELFDAALSK